ncbi:hypothetical protein HGRIS_006622 [Hohenbuehelia grisea]|uniref:Uncharacterized protein n=1 Tax=Hohenbuehelia grisea TaxID=104357 RepID=A0ABR3J9W3_9AGAR
MHLPRRKLTFDEVPIVDKPVGASDDNKSNSEAFASEAPSGLALMERAILKHGEYIQELVASLNSEYSARLSRKVLEADPTNNTSNFGEIRFTNLDDGIILQAVHSVLESLDCLVGPQALSLHPLS